MRRLGHGIGLLMLFALVAGIAQWGWNWLESRFEKLIADVDIEGTRSTVAYVLPETTWLEFPVSGGGNSIRVLSTANVPRDALLPDDARLEYAVRYQLINGHGDVVVDRTHHHRTGVSAYEGTATEEVFTRTFYADESESPTTSQRLMATLAGFEDVATVRLRLATKMQPITSVVTRLSERASASSSKTPRFWQRLSRLQQQLLGDASVYGKNLLTEHEKQQLLESSWRPVGPNGIKGKDYRERRVYMLLEPLGEPSYRKVLPAGLYVDRKLRGVVPLPHPSRDVTLRFSAVESGHTRELNQVITVRWYGRRADAREIHRIAADSDALEWRHHFDAGYLEISAPFPAIVRVFGGDNEDQIEITPETRYLRGYLADAGRVVDYLVDHTDDQATPYRIDLRVPLTTDSAIGSVAFQLVDDVGQVIGEGELGPNIGPSVYDRMLGHQPYEVTTDPARHYFKLGPDVARLRIIADYPVLVSAYSRPPRLARYTRVPQDYDPYLRNHGEPGAVPTWFAVRPEHSVELFNEARVIVLAVQPRPPDNNPDIAAGDYDWVDYLPQGDWLGRHLLNPRLPERVVRNRARGAIYRTIPTGQVTTLLLQGESAQQQIEPTLIFLRPTDEPFNLRVELDGQEVIGEQLTGRRGELRLPTVSAGKHTLRIVTSTQAKWLINYAGAGSETYTRRLAYRLDQEQLHFRYEKESSDEEVLSVRLQMPAKVSGPTRVRVSVKSAGNNNDTEGPVSDFTALEREFEVYPNLEAPLAPVLGTQDQWVERGQTLFLPLGSDLPAGVYPITIWIEGDQRGYLTLYRIKSGPPHRRRFYLQSQRDLARDD